MLATVLAACTAEYAMPHNPPPAYDVEAVEAPDAGDWVVDDWVPPVADAVDLLLVIDDSGSMTDDRARLAANAAALVEPLAARRVDLHVGVTTTSCWTDAADWTPSACDAVIWTTAASGQDLAAWVAWVVLLRSGGSQYEMGLLALDHALADRSGFHRAGVPLRAVIASDEPDQSPMLALTADGLDADLAAMAAWRAGGAAVAPPVDAPGVRAVAPTAWVTVSVVVPTGPGTGCPSVDVASYLDLADRWGGTAWDLCAWDWAPVVAAVLGDPAPIAIWLSRVPDLDTVELHVMLDGVDVVLDDGAWTWDPVPNVVASDRVGTVSAAWVEYRPR